MTKQADFVQKLQEALQQSEHIEQRLKALEPKPLPEIVVEEHRYTHRVDKGVREPMDGWVFVHMSPCSLDQGGSELPFDQNDPGAVFRYAEHVGPSPVVTVEDAEDLFTDSLDEEDWDALRWYANIFEGWMLTPPAEIKRRELIEAGYTKVDWSEIPSESFIKYVQYNIAPLEWQSDLEYLRSMTTIWIKGEWPV